MEACLPHDKLGNVFFLIIDFSRRQKVTPRELQFLSVIYSYNECYDYKLPPGPHGLCACAVVTELDLENSIDMLSCYGFQQCLYKL